MKYVFDYEETLVRRVEICADNLGDAINEMHRRIDEEEIVLSAEDFASGKISMPLEENRYMSLTNYGDPVEKQEGLDLEIDWW